MRELPGDVRIGPAEAGRELFAQLGPVGRAHDGGGHLAGPAQVIGVDDLQHVVRIAMERGVLAGVVGAEVGQAAAHHVEGDGAATRGIARRQQAPHVLVAAEAVGEHEAAGAIALDLHVVSAPDRHASILVMPGRCQPRYDAIIMGHPSSCPWGMTGGAVGETARSVESGRKRPHGWMAAAPSRGVFRACPFRFADTARCGSPCP